MSHVKLKKLFQIILAVGSGVAVLLALLLSMGATNARGAPLLQGPDLSIAKQGNSNWEGRIKLVFTNTVAEDLTEFPVLVVLNSSRIDYNQTRDAGQDIRFVDADGTLLPHEIEQWNENGNSYIWVKVPVISATVLTNYIWLYYNNPTASDGQNPAAVWPTEYRGVWHFNNNTLDTTTGRDAESAVVTPASNGWVAGGMGFDGNGDYVNAGSGDRVDNIFANGGTIMAWIRPFAFTVAPDTYGRILEKSQGLPTSQGWSFQMFDQSTGISHKTIRFERDFTNIGTDGNTRAGWYAPNNMIFTDTWQFVALTYNDATTTVYPSMYINGATQVITDDNDATGTPRSDAEQNLFIGNTSDLSRSYEGVMDEVRVLNTARSANWILAQYRSMADKFIGFSSPEPVSQPAGGIMGAPFTYTLTVSNSSGTLGATGVVIHDRLPNGANYVSGGQLISNGDVVSLTIPSVPAGGAGTANFVITSCESSLVNNDYQVVESSGAATSVAGPMQLSLLEQPTLTADFQLSLSQAVVDQTIFFTDTSTTNGGPFTSQWDFGDGATAQGENVTHAYSASGNYTVTLTIIDTCGFTATTQKPVTIELAFDLTITKNVSATEAQPGQPITYTLTFTNLGPGQARDVTITDVVPITLTGVTVDSSGAGLTPSPGSSFVWSVADLPPNSGGVITLSGIISPAVSATVFTNTAQISATASLTNVESGPAPNEDSAVVRVILPDIAFSSNSYTVNEGSGSAPITLTLSAAPFTTVTVVYTAAGGTATPGEDFVAVTDVLTVAPGQSQVTFNVSITDDLILEPTETVLLSLGQPNGVNLGTPATATLQIIDNDTLILGLKKQSSATQITAGTRLTYTLVVSNSGNIPFSGGVISDTLPGDVTLVPGSVQLTPAGAGTVGSPPALVQDLTINAGQKVTVTFAVTTSAGLADGHIITNTASVTSAQFPVSARDSVTVTVVGVPGIGIAKTGPADAGVGQALVYTFTVTNSGGLPLQIQGISDNVAGTPQRISGDTNGNNFLDLTETWLYTAGYTVPVGAPGSLVNTARVTATAGLNQQVTASASHTTTIRYAPVLTLTKSGPASANVGQMVTFTFAVSHDSLSDRSPITNVTVTDDFAGAATLQSGDDGDGLLEWGETWQFAASYVIVPTTPNPFTNVGLASGQNLLGQVISATASHTMQLSGFNPELFIDEDGPTRASPGERVEFTYTVINVNPLSLALFKFDELTTAAVGDGSPMSDVTVTDSVAGQATYVSGDFNGNDLLDAAEAWIFSAAYTVAQGDSSPLVSVSTARALNAIKQVVVATDTVSIDIFKKVYYLPVIFKNN